MYEYLFLYILAFVAIIFAVVQDLRFREISNWLTFSLIFFVLATRLVYAVYFDNLSFFLFGLGGVFFFVVLGYLLYYGHVFAGGDAKLLFGLGGIFAYNSIIDYLFYGFGFVLLLLIVGVVYTLSYSLVLVFTNFTNFSNEFSKNFIKYKLFFVVSLVIGILIGAFSNLLYSFIFPLFFLMFVYTKSLENTCMIKLVSPQILSEGDWLVSDVRVGNKIILKTVHGVSYEEILLLRKNNKKVWIKSGVPFAPAFLIALVIFLFFYNKFLNITSLF